MAAAQQNWLVPCPAIWAVTGSSQETSGLQIDMKKFGFIQAVHVCLYVLG